MRLLPAETSSSPSPIPTQFVASDEFTPLPQARFPALGPADGPTKRAIFGESSARLYKYDRQRRAALTTDRIALAKADYEREGPGRTNLRYGCVATPIVVNRERLRADDQRDAEDLVVRADRA